MGFRRFRQVFRVDVAHNARRPLFWIWLFLVGWVSWMMSSGSAQIESGDASVGGTKAWITSEFGVALIFAAWIPITYTFFIAVAAGMAVIRDAELRVGELLHATPLRPGEYVWGKFLAILASFSVILGAHVALQVFFNHVTVDAASSEIIGPFSLANYLRPALVFAVPVLLFLGGISFAIGEITKKPILVFVLPVALLLLGLFFFWSWTPDDLDPTFEQLLMLADFTGLRWLTETWLTVDRGVAFYNEAPIAYDTPFVLSRVAFSLVGVLSVFAAHRHFRRNLGGVTSSRRGRIDTAAAAQEVQVVRTPRAEAALSTLGMRTKRVSFLSGLLAVTRVELRELRSQPGLYLFIPLIVLLAVVNSVFRQGPFDTLLLVTPGTLATASMPFLTTLVSLLLMFYMVESLRRERSTRLDSIYYSTSVRTTSMLFGKVLANSLVAVLAMLTTLVTCFFVLVAQGQVPFSIEPFAIVWGLLLVPTFLFWCSFVCALYSILRNAYATYAACIAVLIFTGYKLNMGEMSWVWNWPLWTQLPWSDMGTFELNRDALLLNRALMLAACLFLTVLAVRLFPRRASDGGQTLARLRPRTLTFAGLRLLPFAALPIVLGAYLSSEIDAGHQSDQAEKDGKDYWRKNIATWLDAPGPDLAGVDVTLELEPERRWFRVDGTFQLTNPTDSPLPTFAVTGSREWSEPKWTLNGEEVEPENRALLYVFTPEEPLAPGDVLSLGFAFEGTVNAGLTKNGGGASEFILPAGVVLTSFSPSFVPVIGFVEGVGVDEENSYDAKEYPDDFFEGETPTLFGPGKPYPVRMQITAPEEYLVNSVGTLESDQVADGKRTVVWVSDHPVIFFNVIAGRWDVKRGEGTALYYHPEHDYNVDSMVEALDAARRYFSEWFYPFPWEELKVSEFPALAGYAQGFPTNISFSESIGFLTKNEDDTDLAFMVTAHEAAHQWWGNILTPGKGPGGNILSEGTAHFSTLLLTEEVEGLQHRIRFCRRIESQYGESRQADSERPLVKIDGTRPGDTTVTYDKGGWVFWMLLNHMGRDACLAGIRDFIQHYSQDRDHPVLQDFVRHLRPFAEDEEAYDAFTDQWFFDVVVPEYRLHDVTKEHIEERVEGTDDGGDVFWEVKLRVENVGTGRMPVQVAASRGERFPDEDGDEEEAEPYEEVRTEIVLDAGEEVDVVLRAPFEPERVVVDPDALVLQLRRKVAAHEF